MAENEMIPDDETFALSISENMEIRNKLRSGLVEAQGKDTGKIPVFVSWPRWLDDGIVCLYASDFKEILGKVVTDTARTFLSGDGSDAPPAPSREEAAGTGEFQALMTDSLERVDDASDEPARKDSPPPKKRDKYSTAPPDKYSSAEKNGGTSTGKDKYTSVEGDDE